MNASKSPVITVYGAGYKWGARVQGEGLTVDTGAAFSSAKVAQAGGWNLYHSELSVIEETEREEAEVCLVDLAVTAGAIAPRLQAAYERATTASSMGRVMRLIARIHTEVFAPDLAAL